MPNWKELLDELKESGSVFDLIRRKYLKRLHEVTKRNIIIYYSGWLQKPTLKGHEVNDADKNGFMSVIHKLDPTLGLDLFLHTPGGDTAATESLVEYLRSIFGTNIRAVVPQLALSAGTMMACAAEEILMGDHSSLGPIDPQIYGMPAHGVVEEFNRALKECKDPQKIPVWQPVIAKYHPTLIGECEKAITWSNKMVSKWLESGMFRKDDKAKEKIDAIMKELADHAITKSHGRHLSKSHCQRIGLNVKALEEDEGLQDAVLSVHHTCIHTLSSTPALKIIENHIGTAFIQQPREMVVQQ